MITKRSARAALLACACVASLGLIAGVAPAAAKKKVKKRTVTRTATLNQCVSVASPINSNDAPGGSTSGVANIPVTIPNYKGLPQDGAITAVTSAGVRITHTFDEDLALVLVSPGAHTVPLALSRGENGDGYGSGATNCGGSLVQFADAFGAPISTPGNTGDNPVEGSFKPELPLGSLTGTQARGNWQLIVTDGAGGDDGSLDAFSLNVTYTYKALVKVKKKKKKKK
jgi:subtilisin-like proprotein convertase family protein